MTQMIDKRAAQDWNRIDVHEDWQLQYWATKLQVTKEDVRTAVEAVGDSASEVKKYFGFVGQGRWDKSPVKGGARVG